jgi:ankyrin repeat protein
MGVWLCVFAGETPMTCAAYYGHTDVIKELIENGADVNLVSMGGNIHPCAEAEAICNSSCGSSSSTKPGGAQEMTVSWPGWYGLVFLCGSTQQALTYVANHGAQATSPLRSMNLTSIVGF